MTSCSSRMMDPFFLHETGIAAGCTHTHLAHEAALGWKRDLVEFFNGKMSTWLGSAG